MLELRLGSRPIPSRLGSNLSAASLNAPGEDGRASIRLRALPHWRFLCDYGRVLRPIMSTYTNFASNSCRMSIYKIVGLKVPLESIPTENRGGAGPGATPSLAAHPLSTDLESYSCAIKQSNSLGMISLQKSGGWGTRL